MASEEIEPGLYPNRALHKPAFGALCNGCGVCCALDPCAIAHQWIDANAGEPCPALEFGEGRFWCGMVRRPSHYMRLSNDWGDRILGSAIATALGVRRGCDASDD